MMIKGFNTFLLLFLTATLLQAQTQLSGKVSDETGVAIAQVHVYVAGSSKGTFTDSQGSFSLSVPEEKIELVFSHVSFDKKRVELTPPFEIPLKVQLSDKYLLANQVVVEATRADAETPTTYTNVEEEEIEDQNFGQDLPFILDMTPSVNVTSDAGAGVGYTSMRIRGTDMTRINVTINGIPLNDPESHGVFWVNTPDLASSIGSIQVQRGVGSSTNGAAAFGASVNIHTDQFSLEPYGRVITSAGSFNTLRNTVQFGTGLTENNWAFNGRVSNISSDGYIDRARANLRSWYFEGGYFGENTVLKAVVFGGNEETYQSWWGTPESRLENDVEEMNFIADINGYTDEQRENLLNSGRTFNYYQYENEVDNYSQDHYQLHLNQKLGNQTYLNLALHYTYGRGYFEQFRDDDDFADYDLEPIETTNGTINTTDLIRRRWLENHFLGTTFSLTHDWDALSLDIGGSANRYDGDHFGEVIWSQYSPNLPIRYRYYDNNALKTDLNIYSKWNYQLPGNWNAYVDLQIRNIDYRATGPDNDRVGGVPVQIDVDEQYTFFNPKAGLSWIPSSSERFYLSYARSNREPVRSDFIDNDGTIPLPEQLDNVELGYSRVLKLGSEATLTAAANTYLMLYKNQLVLTGELNDVGASIRRNVDRSYRAGLELQGDLSWSQHWNWQFNATLSRNKIANFTEVIYDYGPAFSDFIIEETDYRNTDISFSPNLIAGNMLQYFPSERSEIAIIQKFVGRQYLDNTQQESRSIDPYQYFNFRAFYRFDLPFLEELRLGLQVNNLLNELYSANGYTFGYKGGGIEVRENYFYPQATRNFMVMMEINF